MSDDEGFEFEDEIEEYSDVEEYEDEEEPVREFENDEEKIDDDNIIIPEKEDEIIIDLENDEQEEKKEKKLQKVDKDKRTTLPYLTKFEKARLIGTRAIQISMGAKTCVSFDKFDPIEIATKELYTKNIPLIIRRHLPNNKYEDWSISELMIF
jgi:DNA-directed RNA polymerase I, II, and III subunit RPABC2